MNNTFVIESFIDYCDKMIIANEKLDTRILDLNFGKTMKLYHGSKHRIIGPIKPTSVNMGNRLTSVRTSSFWTNNFEYASFWAASWTCNLCGVRECIDINTKKIVLPGFYEGSTSGRSLTQIIKEWINANPLYVYEATVDVKHVGRGHSPIDEYTVDIPIKPDKIHELRWKDIEKFIIFAKDKDEYTKYLNTFTLSKSFSKSKTTLLEKMIFRNPDKVRKERCDIYNKLR